MAPDMLSVTIGRTTLSVPVVVDKETTLRLVDQVNDRIATMEAHATRIDSMGFALQAAFSFAADLHKAQTAAEAQERELTVALEGIIDSLRSIVDAAPGTP